MKRPSELIEVTTSDVSLSVEEERELTDKATRAVTSLESFWDTPLARPITIDVVLPLIVV